MNNAEVLKRWIWLRGNPATGGGGGQLLTVTGATPLSLPNALAKPLKKAEFSIEAVQAGSGDPSPQNIRPIYGAQGGTVTVTGENFYPHGIIVEYTYEWYSGSKNLSDAQYPFFLKGGSSYVLSYENSNENAKPILRVWRKDGTILENEPSVLNAKMLTSADAYKYVYSSGPMYYNGVIASNDNALLISPTEDIWIDARIQSEKGTSSNVMLSVGSTPSSYQPYRADTVSVTFPESVGTVYGGTFDPVTGQGVVTAAKIENLGSLSWSYHNTLKVFYANLKVAVQNTNANTNDLSNMFAQLHNTGFVNLGDNQFLVEGSGERLAIKHLDTEDTTAFKAFLNEHNPYLILRLVTPLAFTVPPQSLTPPAGDAYIWASTGTTGEAQYYGKQ